MKNCTNKKIKCHNHGASRHLIHMAICCGLPLVLLALLPLIKQFSPGLYSVVFNIIPFLCPIFMLGMMFMMNSDNNCCEHNDKTNKNQE